MDLLYSYAFNLCNNKTLNGRNNGTFMRLTFEITDTSRCKEQRYSFYFNDCNNRIHVYPHADENMFITLVHLPANLLLTDNQLYLIFNL